MIGQPLLLWEQCYFLVLSLLTRMGDKSLSIREHEAYKDAVER